MHIPEVKIQPIIAARTTLHFFAVLGFILLGSCVLSAHYYAIAVGIPFIASGWLVLYKIEEGIHARISARHGVGAVHPAQGFDHA